MVTFLAEFVKFSFLKELLTFGTEETLRFAQLSKSFESNISGTAQHDCNFIREN